MQTSGVLGVIPHNAENLIKGLVADDCKGVVAPQIMPLSVVNDRLASGVKCFDSSEFGLEHPANLVLQLSKYLRNSHDGGGENDHATGCRERDLKCEKGYELCLY